MLKNNLRTLLAAGLKYRRSVLGISQEELARRAGLDPRYLADLELAARNPSVESVEKLADALHVTVAELFQAPDSK
jgi:transcriptional regulator with XRE-family HTH domain